MKKRICFFCITFLLYNIAYAKEVKHLGTREYAKGIDSKIVVSESNIIMRNIYNDILLLKEKYKEIQHVAEKCIHKDGYEVDKKGCRGYCPPWELSRIQYEGVFFLDIDFSEFPWNEHTWSSPAPLREIYIEKIAHYLHLNIRSDNDNLKKELIEIIEKNIK